MWRRLWRWLLALGVLIVALPWLLLAAFGLWRGHDVVSAFRHQLITPGGETIPADRVPYGAARSVEWLGNLEDLDLIEASGLAVSTRRGDLLWAHNDSGGEHRVFALSPSGRARGRVRVPGQSFGDWEDLASFRLDGASYLLIGNVGDNYRWRRSLELLVIGEPELRGDPARAEGEAPVAWTLRYRYPDGYRDCEAVAVDEAGEAVYLLSKRVIPAEVYRLPLRPPGAADELLVAERVALLDTIPQPVERDLLDDPDYGQYGSQPTGLDIAGRVAAVLTYKDAYLFTRRPGEDWATAFGRVPARVALPPVPQLEAAALSRDARYLYLTSERGERGPTPVFRVDLEGVLPGPGED